MGFAPFSARLCEYAQGACENVFWIPLANTRTLGPVFDWLWFLRHWCVCVHACFCMYAFLLLLYSLVLLKAQARKTQFPSFFTIVMCALNCLYTHFSVWCIFFLPPLPAPLVLLVRRTYWPSRSRDVCILWDGIRWKLSQFQLPSRLIMWGDDSADGWEFHTTCWYALHPT